MFWANTGWRGIGVTGAMPDRGSSCRWPRGGRGNPPENQRCLEVEFSRSLNRGGSREEIPIQRQPDPRDSQAGRERRAGARRGRGQSRIFQGSSAVEPSCVNATCQTPPALA